MANDDTAVEKQEKNADSQEKSDKENVASTEEGAVEEKQAETPEGDENVVKLEAEIEALKQKADDNWNQFLREKAESENARRRAQKDVENARNFAIEKFVQELLPVKDSLEMGLQASQEKGADVGKLKEGTKLTLKMFNNTVAKFGVEVVDPMGKPFNPEFHQAMTMQESDKKPNVVLAVMQKGYLLNGRLIRPAMVVVSKAKTKGKSKDEDNTKQDKTKNGDGSDKNGTNIDEKA